jgi:hypothetical protein
LEDHDNEEAAVVEVIVVKGIVVADDDDDPVEGVVGGGPTVNLQDNVALSAEVILDETFQHATLLASSYRTFPMETRKSDVDLVRLGKGINTDTSSTLLVVPDLRAEAENTNELSDVTPTCNDNLPVLSFSRLHCALQNNGGTNACTLSGLIR